LKTSTFGPITKLNIPYYRKVMKFPLKLLKNEFENMHGVRYPELQSVEEFSAVIEAVNMSQEMSPAVSPSAPGNSHK
jgi:hypothetical protein